MSTSEEITALKNKRSSAKATLTKITKKGYDLMTDERNASEVEQLQSAVDEALEKFKDIHVAYHGTLVDPSEVEGSEIYFGTVRNQVSDFKDAASQWLSDVGDKTELVNDDTEQEVDLHKKLEEIKALKEKEMEDFRLKMEIERQELELEHQRQKQLMELEMQRLHFEQKIQSSTPHLSRARMSFGGLSSVKGDESTVMLKSLLEDQRSQQQYLVNNLNAPKIELMKFHGDPLKYHPFITSFDAAIGSKEIDAATKLNALVQATTGEVNSLLQCCLVKEPTAGYGLARKLLKERHGDESVISQAWVDKMLNRPRIRDIKGLKSFSDELTTCMETLDQMDQLQELETKSSLKALASKLCDPDFNRWLRVNYAIKEKENRRIRLKDFADFVNRLAKEKSDPIFGEAIYSSEPHVRNSSQKSARSKPAQRASFATDVKQPQSQAQKQPHRPRQPLKCPKCNSSHFLNQCTDFRVMSVRDRRDFVMKAGLCMNCFQHGHRAVDCSKTWTCNITGCGQKHNRWVHPPNPSNQDSGAAEPEPETTDQQKQQVTTATTVINKAKIALPIVTVLVKSAAGAFVEALALLDNCSSGSLCTEELVDKLGLPSNQVMATLNTVGGRIEVKTKTVDLDITSLSGETTHVLRQVLTRPTLNIDIDNLVTRDDLKQWRHLRDLDLPEADINKVSILIGQDNPDLLIPLDTQEGDPGDPYAVKTCLGWGVSGPVGPRSHRTKHSIAYSSHFTDFDLHKQVEKFWVLDSLGGYEEAYSITDKRVIQEWESSLIVEDDGHYSMNIPFKKRPPGLPNNYSTAANRLKSTGRRLVRDPELREMYVRSVREAVDLGYAEAVPDEELRRADGAVWYLPHHAVKHPRKPGKVRVVFDGAAKYRGTSLNEQVHKGPDLTNKLVGVLSRFRQEPVAFAADIEAMFNQVKVNKPDRDVLRFLWWKNDNPSEEPVQYRMTTHLFGGVWSPSCATYALKKTAEEFSSQYDPETATTVDRNFYVDDCLKSVISVPVAIRLMKQLRSLLELRGFHLTKFVSNSREVLKSLPDSEKAKSIKNLDLDGNPPMPMERTLGLLWDVEKDAYVFQATVPATTPSTKRGILSAMSSVYDPLGFVSPFILRAKWIFQSLCRLGVGWDDEVPEEIGVQWIKWKEDLPNLTDLQVPRCFKPPNDLVQPVTMQLHHFADASEVGLGAVSYLRFEDAEGERHTCLVMAKSRLAPIKTSTIPRLELTAATVAVRMDRMLRKELEIPQSPSVFWTDSTIVLQYLNNEEKRYQTFVANRVEEIRSHSKPTEWRHVPSGLNPADDVSRGMSAKELAGSKRWLEGPPFLRQEEDQWPSNPISPELPPEAEVKKEKQICYVEQSPGSGVLDSLVQHYSSWFRLKKAVAWILRLKDRLLKIPTRGERLTVWEMERAENAIIAQVQSQTIIGEQKQSLRRLSPVNADGLLRVGGRLGNAPLSTEAQHPVILPSKHRVTELVVRSYHEICGHGGSVRTLAEVRQKYWPLRGHATVKGILRSCIICRKIRAPMETQRMADLPTDRVTPKGPAFTSVGVDYFGPMMIKRGRTEYKRYGCIFTCLTTRAIHLEVAHSLDTDSFIQSLQRFIARRGEPQVIRSDNGTNFVGAKKELAEALKEWNQGLIDNFLLQKGVQWLFNPPGASHMGGVWERMIRSVRALILGLNQQQKLTDESLSTLMCNVEVIVNGRPLTKLSDDPNDPSPLTPNHLLLLRSGPKLPPGKFVVQDLYRRRWRQVSYLADVFWTRWLKEYLPSLQERRKWLCPKRNLQPGDLILLMDSNAPRNKWPLGLVTKVFPGQDGLVRSAQVKTQSGVYVRPVTKLCLLEGNLGSA